MGVAFGEFFPEPKFAQFYASASQLEEYSRKWDVDKCILADGEVLEETAWGIVIIEYDMGSGDSYLEVSCLGISYPLYEHLFPHHVKAYEEQFSEQK